MNTTWIKTKGNDFRINGELFISEWVNPFTGQAIRKSWRMTGHDWHIFDADGSVRRASFNTLGDAEWAAENKAA